MKIVVNGADARGARRLTVAELVARARRRRRGRSRRRGRGRRARSCRAAQWDGVELTEGQRVEVLGAIQGG